MTPGAEWLVSRIPSASTLGRRVADILNTVWRGIYHISDADLLLTEDNWSHEHVVEIRIYSWVSTFDDDQLTALVILCHDRCVRLCIGPRNMHYITLRFTLRGRRGGINRYHPTLEAAIERVRSGNNRVNSWQTTRRGKTEIRRTRALGLACHGNLTYSELKSMGMPSPGYVIKSLIRDGLIEPAPRRNDRKLKRYRLTLKGLHEYRRKELV
jgi:hypothetical protein